MRRPLVLTLVALAVALALVLSWSFGAFGAGGSSCTKVGSGAIKIADLGMAHNLKLGTMYAVPYKSVWLFAGRIPGTGVAVWSMYNLTPTSVTANGSRLPRAEPMNPAALDNWRLPSLIGGLPDVDRKSAFRAAQGLKEYQQAVACFR